MIVIGLIIFVVGSAELGARYLLGLGTPPLSVAHPSIEYMYAPNQDLYRFGNHQLYNEFGMRSVPLRQVNQQHRVLVFGDSVLNGGALTDQSALATTFASDSKIFFGNVSAGSWGPANLVAWIDEYGLLGTDKIIVLLSSHDLYDTPRFAPLNPKTHPTTNPTSALTEGIVRYLPRYVPGFGSLFSDASPHQQVDPTPISAANAISDFIDRAEVAGIGLCAIQHKTQDELNALPDQNTAEIHDIFADRGVPTLDFGSGLAAAGKNPYRDNIHINDYGQKLLDSYLRRCSDLAALPS